MNKVKFVDLYSGNNFLPGQVKMDGFNGVIFKAGQGGWADVPRYRKEWWQQAKDAELLVGWYWLCDSRHHSSEHIDEMRKFKIFDDIGELGLWVDVEKPKIAMTETDYWKTKYAGHENVIDFTYLITREGIKPGIYTGPGAYSLVMRDAPKTAHDYLAQFDLWTAQYPYIYTEASKPSLYGSWTKWNFWQWREGPDVNIYNGTDEEFYSRYGSTQEPTGEKSMYKGTVLISSLNIRPSASVSQPKIAQLLLNDKIEAFAKIKGWWRLSKIFRNGAEIPLPAMECYAFEGDTGGYIRTDSFTDTPPVGEDVVIGVTISNGVTQSVSVNNEVWKNVCGCDGNYQISNLGRLKSTKRRKEITCAT